MRTESRRRAVVKYPGSLVLRICGIEPEELTILERLLFVVVVLLVMFNALKTFMDVMVYSGVDIRNRVVGARVLLRGIDPYTFHWRPGMPTELLDPVYDPRTPLHRLTAPPTTLCIYATVASLPYRAIRVISWVAEWSAVVMSFLLLGRMLSGNRLRLYFLLLAGYFCLASYFWRAHVEHGQVYVFHLLGLTVGSYYAAKGAPQLDKGGCGVRASNVRPAQLPDDGPRIRSSWS